jgi:hypothetical protein
MYRIAVTVVDRKKQTRSRALSCFGPVLMCLYNACFANAMSKIGKLSKLEDQKAI